MASGARRRIVHVASEHSGFVHTGGLGEVMAGLPVAQLELGHDVHVVLPGTLDVIADLEPSEPGPRVSLPWATHPFGVATTSWRGVTVHVLDEPALFRRSGLYGDGGSAYADNAVRFSVFCRAAAQLVAGLGEVDVVHLHDYHAGLVAPLVVHGPRPRPGVVFTVHNLAFQGAFPEAAWELTGLPQEARSYHGVLHNDLVNPLKAGIQYADQVTTVSPTYARELTDDSGGWDLAPLFRWRREDLTGIVNGLSDAGEPAPHGRARVALRRALCEEAGLTPPAGPLFIVVSRLTGQKGIDLIAGAVSDPRLADSGLLVVGTGESALAAALRACADAEPARIAFLERFDTDLAARCFAGGDVALVPSRFEPCGLTQLHAMRAGALPLVRRTGGLADTVRDVGEPGGWGVVFEEASPSALADAMARAASLYTDPMAWATAVGHAQSQPIGWSTAAARYDAVYDEACVRACG